ncbi:MAG: hypothetical protein HC929_12330 [Leptolyngbyaceae cyanobacterium SM2_5_2]|nr:hypothetical protein [Leptolyngbyaceae cyanobacterium SM2_5_2]
MGVALQESVLFSGKVRENICYGKPEATEDEMVEAAQAADAHGFVSAIPEGYDAAVSRRGTNFRGDNGNAWPSPGPSRPGPKS